MHVLLYGKKINSIKYPQTEGYIYSPRSLYDLKPIQVLES